MKYVFLFLLVPVMAFAQGDMVNVDDANWLTNYDAAVALAKKDNKNIMVYFTGSDWCPPCKMLKKDLFDTSEFKSIAEDYVLLYIDIPRNRDLLSKEQMEHNTTVLSKLNQKGVFPLLKVINENGSELDEMSGYSMNGEVQYHLAFLKKNK